MKHCIYIYIYTYRKRENTKTLIKILNINSTLTDKIFRSARSRFYLSLIGIILRWGFLIWELIFYLLRTFFFSHLGSFCVVSSFTTFRPNFTSGLLQVILPRPRIGMLSLVTVSPVITAFHSCLSHHVFDQVNLWPAWVGFETAIFWQCSPGTAETQRLYPLRHAINKKLILMIQIY